MKLEVCPDSGFLRVGAVGEFSLGEARRTFLEMLEAVALHKVLGFNRWMQHTRNCVSRRSVADEI